jgi:hypothetical protein
MMMKVTEPEEAAREIAFAFDKKLGGNRFAFEQM